MKNDRRLSKQPGLSVLSRLQACTAGAGASGNSDTDLVTL